MPQVHRSPLLPWTETAHQQHTDFKTEMANDTSIYYSLIPL